MENNGQFLLYTGPVVLQNKLHPIMYSHFVSLYIAVRLLCENKCTTESIEYAEKLLKHFVKNYIKIYGLEYISPNNVHGLLHIADDAKEFGSLDNFSAFKFENFMKTLNIAQSGKTVRTNK